MSLLPILREVITEKGSISIAEYMELCLGHPEHGYYRKQDPLGARGDFITSPEISQIFGEMLGVWVGNLWQQMGGGPAALVEFGPGRGTLMADMLRATKKIPEFHESLSVHMVETSPVLANAQYLRLRHEHPRIEWLEDVRELPEKPCFIVANEFFDALPIRQYVQAAEGVRERRIDWNAQTNALEFTLGPVGLSLASGKQIPMGTIMEQCPAARSIMRQLAGHIRTHGGAGLFIDYGYLGEAHQDTLQAVKAHLYHPILSEPGDADITAHVDFQSLMEIARGEGVAVHGLIGQGHFLERMGASLRLEILLRSAVGEQRNQLITGLQRLMSPQAMGELFKVMAILPNPDIEPLGFYSA